MSETQPEGAPAHEQTALRHVEEFFAYIFGEALPVRVFEDSQREMEYLRGGTLYGTVAPCDLCGSRYAPRVVTVEEGEEIQTTWKATCLDCYGQVRLPARETDEGWEFADEPEYVALDPVPTYEQRSLDTDTDSADDSE